MTHEYIMQNSMFSSFVHRISCVVHRSLAGNTFVNCRVSHVLLSPLNIGISHSCKYHTLALFIRKNHSIAMEIYYIQRFLQLSEILPAPVSWSQKSIQIKLGNYIEPYDQFDIDLHKDMWSIYISEYLTFDMTFLFKNNALNWAHCHCRLLRRWR